ncbi:MAG: HPr family phosphocarrier protein [Kiloniellales bacterium]|nr:HPr family phosphocarrier protein [Kiloniellales bacterium]
MTAASDSSVWRRVTIVNGRGLHARAAAKFVKLAGTFDAEIIVARNDMEVSGSSIMGLMMLGAAPGCELELRASGQAAEAALEALSSLIANRFDEEI